jgi:hypothetical protein
MLYNDNYADESQCGMAKEPSVQIKEELHSHVSEGSADEANGNHAPHLMKSGESVDNPDYIECSEMLSIIHEQDTEADVRGVDGMEYEDVDASQYSVERLSHSAYADGTLVGEQNTDTDAEGAHVVEYETYDFGHHSADKLDCAKYTEIPWTQIERYTDADADGIDEVEYDINDIDQHSDQLQSTEEQEDSFDQHSHEYIKNAESAAKRLKVVCAHCRFIASY